MSYKGFVPNMDLHTCRLRAEEGKTWYIRLHSKKDLAPAFYWEAWGRGIEIGTVRCGTLGCSADNVYFDSFKRIEDEIRLAFETGLELEKDDVKAIEWFDDKPKNVLFPQYPSYVSTQEKIKASKKPRPEEKHQSMKQLLRSHKEKAEW